MQAAGEKIDKKVLSDKTYRSHKLRRLRKRAALKRRLQCAV